MSLKFVVSTTSISFRVAHPAPDLGRAVFLVHPDDARIVDHLHEDHHVVVGLHDPLEIVVEHRKHRGPRCGTEPQQAAFGEGPNLGVIVGFRRVRAVLDDPPGGARVLPLFDRRRFFLGQEQVVAVAFGALGVSVAVS